MVGEEGSKVFEEVALARGYAAGGEDERSAFVVVFAVGGEFGKGEYEMHGGYNLAKIRGGEAARNEALGRTARMVLEVV